MYIKIYKGGFYHIQLNEVALTAELKSIDGKYLESNNISSNDNTSTTTAKVINSGALTHVLKLKSGSEIMCKILEFKPTENIKIETFDGSIFVYKVEEINELIENEISVSAQVVKGNTNDYRNNGMTGNFEEVEKKGFKFVKNTTVKRFYNEVELKTFYQIPDFYEFKLKSSWLGIGLQYTAGYQLNPYLMLGANIGLNAHLGEEFKAEIDSSDGYIIGYAGLSQRITLLPNKMVSPIISFDENFGWLVSHDGRFIFDFESSVGVRVKTKNSFAYQIALGYIFQEVNLRVYKSPFSTSTHIKPFKTQNIKLSFGLSF